MPRVSCQATRSFLLPGWSLALVLALLGCSAANAPKTVAPAESSWIASVSPDLPPEFYPSQRIYRVRYDGPEGGGRLRLVLRIMAEEAFQLTASDALGRSLWDLEFEAEQLVLVDHRRKRVCRGRGKQRIPELALSELPPATVPRLLLGLLPMPPRNIPVSNESLEFSDEYGRRWTATVDVDRVRSWMMWDGESALLWWRAEKDGGILSHREGVQFRWRETVVEDLLGVPTSHLEAPDGYQDGGCHDLVGS